MSYDTQLTRAQMALIDYRPAEIETLPPPDVTWSWSGVDPDEYVPYPPDVTGLCETVNRSMIEMALKSGVIERVDRRWCRGSGQRVGIYRTDPRCYERIRDRAAARDASNGLLPCNHSAMHTREDGRIECTHETCGQVFAKSTVRAHQNGGEA